MSLALVLSALAPARVRAADASARFQAIRAFDEGRFEHVLVAAAELDAQPEPELSYLRARALAELDRFAEALEVITTLPAEWPEEVRADFAVRRERWTARAGRCSELRESADSKQRASCAFTSGDYASAALLYENQQDLEARVRHALSLLELGQRDSGVPLARALYIEAPAHAEMGRLERLLSAQEVELALTPDEHLVRAEALLAARRGDDALRELEPVKPGPPERAARLFHLRGEAFFRNRHRYAEAAKAFARAAELAGPTEAYDAFHAVRARSRAGQDRAAIKDYRAFAKKYPKSQYVSDALYLSAWLSAREQLPSARDELVRFADSDVAKGAPGLRQDALWDLVMLALRRADGDEARTWLERFARGAEKPFDKARASYWLGRAALLRKDDEGASGHFREALTRDPLGYYAQLAATRLRQLGLEPAPPWLPNAPGPTQPTVQPPPAVAFYARLGLSEDAARAAEPWLESLKERTAKVAALLTTHNTARAYAAAEPLMMDVLSTPPDGSAGWLWRALFPEPYRYLVHSESARHELDPAELYGHMQIESRYKVRAISGADALGLLQLLPSTATSVAAGRGTKVSRRDILSPHVNIELAAAYLAGLVAHYGGQLPPAIAAYNAGTSRVDEWLARSPEPELDLWVEEIPVEQTRNYVRRVIGAWGRYRALATPASPYAITLPERLSEPAK